MNSLSKKIVQLPSLKEVAEYNGDIIIPGGEMAEESEEARIKRLEQRAKEIVREAEKKAEQIIVDAKQQAARIKEEAYEEGHDEGKTLGVGEYEALVLEQKSAFAHYINELQHYRDHMFEDIQRNMTDIILYLADRILHYQFDESNEPINQMIIHTVDTIKEQAKIIVKISTEDFGKLDIDQIDAAGVEIVIDEKLKHGDIKFICDAEQIDLGLDGQLKRLAAELRDK